MMFLFEDSERSPLSALLRHLLKSQRVRFSETNGQLQNVTERIVETELNEGENLFVFIDVVPDNKALTIMYAHLLRFFDDYPNVFLIPWFGAECHTLMLLNRILNDPDITAFLQGLKTVRFEDAQKKNMEKASKIVLENVTNQQTGCTLNRANTSGVASTNLFYTTDCTCQVCNLNMQGRTQEQKACELYTTLPMKVQSDTEFPDYLAQIYSWNTVTYFEALEAFTGLYNIIKENIRNRGKEVYDI